MSAADFATFGAAALGASSLIALVAFYVSFGLERPTGRRTRIAALTLLAVTGIGYSVEWYCEVTAGEDGRTYYWAGLRSMLALVMLHFAYAVWQDGKDRAHGDAA
ncbi:MAG TPA: hypothetical protein VH475_24050 [Tepidisphaeraceae bacterium]